MIALLRNGTFEHIAATTYIKKVQITIKNL